MEKEGRRHLLLLKQIRVIDEENYELRVPHDFDELSLTDEDTIIAENCTYFGRKGSFKDETFFISNKLFPLFLTVCLRILNSPLVLISSYATDKANFCRLKSFKLIDSIFSLFLKFPDQRTYHDRYSSAFVNICEQVL